MVTERQLGIGLALIYLGAKGHQIYNRVVHGPDRRQEYVQMQEDMKYLTGEYNEAARFRDFVTNKARAAATDKALSVPHVPLDVCGTPRPERDVQLGFGDFFYDGETINFQAEDGGVKYDITLINNGDLSQEDFIDSWLALLGGGYEFGIRHGAKYHRRTDEEQANGSMPYPVCIRTEKDEHGVAQNMKIFIDDPRWVYFVPILPGDRHFPETPFQYGLDVAERLQKEGPTDKNKALADDFIRRYSCRMTDRDVRNLQDIMAVTGNIRADMQDTMAEAYRQRLEDSEKILVPGSD